MVVGGWRRAPTVAVASRFAHSSAAFAKQPDEENHTGSLPMSSVMDMRIVVQWGLNEESRLYVRQTIIRNRETNPNRQPRYLVERSLQVFGMLSSGHETETGGHFRGERSFVPTASFSLSFGFYRSALDPG